MRVSQLVHRLSTDASGDAEPAGYTWLRRAGYVVQLGPGLVGGTPLLQRSLVRVETALVRAAENLGAQQAALPASEGEALVHLLAAAGWGGETPTERTLMARGAGFREDVAESRGLFDLTLYRRLDVARATHPDVDPSRPLVEALGGALERLGLPGATAAEEGGETLFAATVGGLREPLGRVVDRTAELPGGSARLALASLDLHAVLGALAEQHHDARGLAWTPACAPFDVAILSAGPPDRDVLSRLLKLETDLAAAGLAVLVDDRGLEPALQRRTAEMLGIPWRVVCGPTSARGEVVLESRHGGRAERVPAARLAERLGHGPARRRLRQRATY